MGRLLFMLSAIPLLFCSEVMAMPDCINSASNLSAYNDGHEIVMTVKENDKLKEILNELVSASQEMPAYGVSIHKHTMEALQKGLWVKLSYDEVYENRGMPFDSLLLQVEKDWQGANLIRGTRGIYSGRCFYLNFEKNMEKLYNFLSDKDVSEKMFTNDEIKITDSPAEDFDGEMEIKIVTKEISIKPNQKPATNDTEETFMVKDGQVIKEEESAEMLNAESKIKEVSIAEEDIELSNEWK